MTPKPGKLRRFHFNLPQRIAAILLALFLLQGFWLISHAPMSDRDYQYARCGRQMWEHPFTQNEADTGCAQIYDSQITYRLAGLPLSLYLLAERGIDKFRAPEDRIVQTEGTVSAWELRHQMPYMPLFERLPFLFCGFVLGSALWWVTRRLYGNFGGYTALSLYCFSPAIVQASSRPGAEILAALGIFAGTYTCIGVAHAMQGPRSKWRPRILLLTITFALAAAAHTIALPIAILLGLAFMLWITEGRVRQIVPVIGGALLGALLLLFACCGFSIHNFCGALSASWQLAVPSLNAATHFFGTKSNAGIALASLAAILLYAAQRRSRYFGNTTPLLCLLALFSLVAATAFSSPWLWSLPFLLTFIGGVLADAYELRHGRVAMCVAGALVLLQAALCLLSLPTLV